MVHLTVLLLVTKHILLQLLRCLKLVLHMFTEVQC